MKLLLTSAGIKNASINDAMVDLLGKPIAECHALAIPTAGYGHGRSAPGLSVHHRYGDHPDVRVGLEVPGRAGAHRAAQHRQGGAGSPWVRETDVLLANGGDALYLGYWMRSPDYWTSCRRCTRQGLGRTERRQHGDDAAHRERTSSAGPTPDGSDTALGLVDFSIFPHLDHPDLPDEHHGRRRTVGGRGPGSGVRDRRRDRHSRLSTAPSKSSPKGTGSCSTRRTKSWPIRFRCPPESRNQVGGCAVGGGAGVPSGNG